MRVRGLAATALALVLADHAAYAQAQPSGDPPTQGAVPTGASGAVPVAPKGDAADTKAAIDPPRLLHFQDAPYPPEAQKEGREADVVLQISIDAAGKVTNVLVIQEAGHGFDEAAAQAAKQFVFEPARRGGTPIASRILYRYAFTLKPAAAAEQAPEKAAQGPTDSLRGMVRVSGADFPLAGAQIAVRDAAGREVTLTTGEDGTWKINDLAPGMAHVTVTAGGYDTLAVDEEIVPGSATEVVYRLSPASSETTVTIRGTRPPREVTRRTLDQREITRIPGTNGDALRSLQNLPGVARPPGLAGLLIVRGSAPQDTQVFVDGTLVPIVYHFGGLSSVVPSEMLEKIDFYPGNFSSQYGRVMGGIVDVGIRAPNSDGKYHAMGQVDLIDARAVAEGPIPGAKGWSFLAGARRSWVDVWLKPVLVEAGAGVTTAPVYYDYQLFASTNPTPRSTFRVGVFGSDDRLDILIKDPSEQDPTLGGSIGLHTGFWRAQALYRSELTDTLRYTAMLAYGEDRVDFGLGTYYFRLRIHPVSHRSEFSTRLSPGVTLHTGLDLEYAPYEVNIRFPPPPRPGEPDPGPYAARPPVALSTTDDAWRPAAYAEAELSPSERAKLVPGVRVDYAADTKSWDLSPRGAARYDLAHGFPRTTMKGGLGIFYQPPQFQETSPVFGTPGVLVSNRAIHYSLGLEQEITRHVEGSIEGFYKDLDQLVVRAPNDQGGYSYTNGGTGYVVGSELLIKYKPDAHFFGWLSYTLSRSTRKEPPDYVETLFQYDQTHILTILGSYRFSRGWEFGARWRLVSGNLYTPVAGGLYNADAGAYAAVDRGAFTQRLPMFHQLDLRVDKVWKFDAWSLRAYLDVQNVYNRSNPEDKTYNYNYSQSTNVSFLPIIPSIGIRGEI